MGLYTNDKKRLYLEVVIIICCINILYLANNLQNIDQALVVLQKQRKYRSALYVINNCSAKRRTAQFLSILH
jgi:hypothetical protein